MVGRLAILAMRDPALPKRKRGRAPAPAPAPQMEKRNVPAITPKQIAAARALLGWSQDDLAGAVGMQRFAINRIERELVAPRGSTLDEIEKVLREYGVELVYGDAGAGEGVRFADPKGLRPQRVEPPVRPKEKGGGGRPAKQEANK